MCFAYIQRLINAGQSGESLFSYSNALKSVSTLSSTPPSRLCFLQQPERVQLSQTLVHNITVIFSPPYFQSITLLDT